MDCIKGVGNNATQNSMLNIGVNTHGATLKRFLRKMQSSTQSRLATLQMGSRLLGVHAFFANHKPRSKRTTQAMTMRNATKLLGYAGHATSK